jgi:hypothetical protein
MKHDDRRYPPDGGLKEPVRRWDETLSAFDVIKDAFQRVSHAIVLHHDEWCDFLRGDGDCNCEPTTTIHVQPRERLRAVPIDHAINEQQAAREELTKQAQELDMGYGQLEDKEDGG